MILVENIYKSSCANNRICVHGQSQTNFELSIVTTKKYGSPRL